MTKILPLLALVLFLEIPVFSQGDIRGVDFKNFTYPAFCVGDTPENVSVKDGEFYKETKEDDYVDRFFFQVSGVSYGDLTRDGRDEAVILTICNTGGTGNFSEGFIYTLNNGKPSLIGRIPGGDRAYGGLRSARVEKGLLIVESNDVGELGGACCPEFVVTSRYRLNDSKLVKAGTADRRQLYPKERVTFARGTSGKTFKVTIPSGEIKRYAVGARAHQMLRVSTDSRQISARLLEDAPVTEGVDGFSARLPKTGDYTIELQNTSDSPIQVTVNIKIIN